ncbi:glycerol-3-phosphate 1-O-acyltransferase PlsY [Jannaschia rubra]|uniref:Glycerol-3-phosphate acyltransferase n=1 Tax=Jannaschia rubra TaxID=282197 RepID=A0A0M6XRD1_9RHOB|nr:glycerol-3-phosphate 1-O-acyltransferase PlsY [Jannaschia rubra]CTQ33696.1 G3P acyltransferase [Jannaschia rubra]SFG06798.1 acyl-phosphate glycerol-3-phosphate acyltransferase [Jannaschia rubra]
MPELVTSYALLALTGVLSYLLGSVSFGIVVTRLFRMDDLRTIGSGNIGATNVLRTGNRTAAFLTLVGDAGKGALAVLLARWLLAEDAAQLAGLMAFVGHSFPVFLRFRGGKGVATALGTLLALSPVLGICVCLTWLATAAVTRISSVAALLAAASSPLWALWLRPQAALLCLVLAGLIIWWHAPNIRRLRAGMEPRIGQK